MSELFFEEVARLEELRRLRAIKKPTAREVANRIQLEMSGGTQAIRKHYVDAT